MIFSKQKKFLYIRVPKAASSVIVRVLSNPYDVESFQNRCNNVLELSSDVLLKNHQDIFNHCGKSIDPNHIPLSIIDKYVHFFFGEDISIAVSYTHLTLPTILRV